MNNCLNTGQINGKGLDFELLFGPDSPPVVVSESLYLREFSASLGFEVMNLEEMLDHPPPAIFFIPTAYQAAHSRLKGFSDAFSVSRVLVVPVFAFDSSDYAATYTLSRVLESDFGSALTNGLLWASRFQSNQNQLMFRGTLSSLEVKKSLSFSLNLRRQMEIDVGEVVAVGEYLEAEMEGVLWNNSPFRVNGSIEVKAMLAARHPYLPRECQAKFERANKLIQEINTSGERIWLELQDNVIKKFSVGKSDLLSTLDELTNEFYALNLTEFAIGLNRSIRDTVDWSINSVINEGAGLLHVAVGDGITGAHIDFICDDITEWTGPAEDGWQAI